MRYYAGLMSGTSLDGVDGVLVEIQENSKQFSLVASAYTPFSNELRNILHTLQLNGADEIHRVSQASNQLMLVYADCVLDLLKRANVHPPNVVAIGSHGQTVRHRPEFGYTVQINNPALLAELTDIDVVADFRSRDIAAGGQGAPLVPAFHRMVFGEENLTRVIANIGGMSNISILHKDGSTCGFDTGPGNVLMDLWTMQHQMKRYDNDGCWAASGKVHVPLLDYLEDEPFFHLAPPKSTGRELFNDEWLQQKLTRYSKLPPADVQATLCALTAHTLANAMTTHAPDVKQVFVCVGGAYNQTLMEAIKSALAQQDKVHGVSVETTQSLGVSPNHVEASAFAWLAYQFTHRLSGNLPEVTGASGPRVLGALYPH